MPSTSAGVCTAGTPLTERDEEIALDVIVRFSPARAYASPEMVSFAPGFTVVALRPIVNGALLATFAEAGVAAAPPDVAASAAGAPAKAVAASAPMPASLKEEIREREWNIGVSVCFTGLFLRGRRVFSDPHRPNTGRPCHPYPATALPDVPLLRWTALRIDAPGYDATRRGADGALTTCARSRRSLRPSFCIAR